MLKTAHLYPLIHSCKNFHDVLTTIFFIQYLFYQKINILYIIFSFMNPEFILF